MRILKTLFLILFLPFLAVYLLLRAGVWACLNALLGRGLEPGEPYDMVCLSHVSWDHIWQRNHHTMTRFARRRKLLYAVPEYAHVALKYPDRLRPWRPKRHDGLIYFKIFLLPGETRSPLIARLNLFITRATIRRLIRIHRLNQPVLWHYFPIQVRLADSLGQALTVYDIQDRYAAFSWAPRNLAECEAALLRRTDVVFTGTDALRQANVAHSDNIHFFPCGVDFDHFATTNPSITPPELEGLQGPILGYFGLIDDRIDAALLEHLARAHPDWRIVMIGPIDAKVFSPPPLPNLHFTGQKDYAQLPHFLQYFDVCLLPFAINELTRNINPTKTLEYFASGKPVVSTAIPDVRKYYHDVLDVADDYEAFERHCAAAIENPDAARLDAAREIARARSWERMVDDMDAVIRDTMKKKADS